jgi:hypothetical protein
LVMLKPGLGKGLGELMRGDDVAGKNGASEADAPRAKPTFGRGLQTLVSVAAQQPEPIETPDQAPPILPTWFYFAADLLLLAYTIAIAFDATRPFDAGTWIFCAVAISVGAALAVVGVLQAAR